MATKMMEQRYYAVAIGNGFDYSTLSSGEDGIAELETAGYTIFDNETTGGIGLASEPSMTVDQGEQKGNRGVTSDSVSTDFKVQIKSSADLTALQALKGSSNDIVLIGVDFNKAAAHSVIVYNPEINFTIAYTGNTFTVYTIVGTIDGFDVVEDKYFA